MSEKKPSLFDRYYQIGDDNPLVRFYEAEKKLTPEDRTELGESIRKISFYSNYGAYGSATIAYFLPTILYNYKNPGAAPAVNINGKEVKPMFVFRRPFLSVFVAFGTLLVTKLLVSTIMVSKEEKRSENSRQKEVWGQLNKLPTMGLAVYGEYLLKSATDALIRMKDPREVAKDLRDHPNAVRYIPTLDNSKTKPGDPEDPSAGEAWQHIREENGFPKKGAKTTGNQEEAVQDSKISDFFSSDGLEEEPNSSESQNNSPTSSWERIRKTGSTGK